MNKIHRASDSGNTLTAQAPVCEIPVLRYLKGTENCHVQMTAPHHGKAVGMVEKGCARLQCNRFLAGINEIQIFFAEWWCIAGPRW